jgi:protein TonB
MPTASASIAPIALASAAQTGDVPLQSGSAADGAVPPAQEPGKVVSPSSSAAYLHNPPPDYPPMSRLRHETGTVVVRVLIGVDGRAQAAQIEKTSGYVRLDDAALTTARDRWRYRPGTRGGVPEAMWYDVPIQFVLE